MPGETVYLSDEEQQQLSALAKIQGKTVEQCLKDLALDRMRERVSLPERPKAPLFSLQRARRVLSNRLGRK